MQRLLYSTYGEKSPVQLRKDMNDTTLDQIPLFRIAEAFLKIIQRDQHIKLTPLGALPKKVMVELYDKRYLLEEHIEQGITKLWREEDCAAIRSARLTTELAGLVKKVKGKLSLTKTATQLLKTNNRLKLFELLFQAFTERFLWSYNDGYPEQHVGQLGWAFSIFMLNKFGEQPLNADFYAKHYRKAFPSLLSFFRDDSIPAERQFFRCYAIRTFDRFFLWFGFASVEQQNRFINLDSDKFTRSNLLREVFVIEEA